MNLESLRLRWLLLPPWSRRMISAIEYAAVGAGLLAAGMYWPHGPIAIRTVVGAVAGVVCGVLIAVNADRRRSSDARILGWRGTTEGFVRLVADAERGVVSDDPETRSVAAAYAKRRLNRQTTSPAVTAWIGVIGTALMLASFFWLENRASTLATATLFAYIAAVGIRQARVIAPGLRRAAQEAMPL